jgi:hypothetical protein
MRSLFVTKLYEAEVSDPALLGELAHSIRTLSRDDQAGKAWSKEHRYAATPATPRSMICQSAIPRLPSCRGC